MKRVDPARRPGRRPLPTPARSPRPRRGAVDRRLRALTVWLVVFGLVMVYSSSSVLSIVQHGSSTTYLVNQVTKAIVGLALMLVVAAVDYRAWGRASKPLVWIAVAMLAFLALPIGGSLAPEINGARRWIRLPAFAFQPVEVAKLALVVWMAATIARKGAKLDRPSEGLVPLVLLPGIMAVLVLLQPDFKGAAILLALAAALLFLGGVRWRYLAGIGVAAAPALGLSMVLEPYRMRRLTAFLDPGGDVQGISYQINQSLISLGSGGWLGVGLGSSKQKFAFLPMAHTDFIVSIVGEELGVFGSLVLLGAFLFLGALGFRIARRAPDPFGFLLASGLTTLLLGSALLNMGVATAVLPTTGLPLPLVSYGGTALVVHLVAIGILLSVSRDAIPPRRSASGVAWWPGRRGASGGERE